MNILKKLGLSPNENDKKLKILIDNTYKTVRVVGRGTITIDPSEVKNSSEFKEAQKKAKKIVEGIN